MSEITVGSVVMLRSCFITAVPCQPMTVTNFDLGEHTCECMWFDDERHAHTIRVRPEALLPIKSMN